MKTKQPRFKWRLNNHINNFNNSSNSNSNNSNDNNTKIKTYLSDLERFK